MEEDERTETVLEKMAEILKERGYEYELDPEWRDGTLVYKDKAGSFHECWRAGSSELVNVIITVTPEQALSVDDLNEIIDENAKLRESLERAAGIIADICGECPACRYEWLSSDGCAEKCGTVTEEECWIAYLTGKRWDESGVEVDE